jgi:hypothetical protein
MILAVPNLASTGPEMEIHIKATEKRLWKKKDKLLAVVVLAEAAIPFSKTTHHRRC